VDLSHSLRRKTWILHSAPSAGRNNVADVLRQSEHLSFFSEHSLSFLGQAVSATSRVEVASIMTPDGKVMKVIQALFVNDPQQKRKEGI
jgi:Mg2+/Co2+ transporter CorC